MQKLKFIIVCLAISQAALAQSNSFQTLKDQFSGTGNVFHFSVSGWLCRAGLSIAGEHEYLDALHDIKTVRIITIPKSNFRDQNLTVKGFKAVLTEDHFQPLMNVKDGGDDVAIYLQQSSNKSDRYFVLIEESNQVTAIEIKGRIDMNKLYKLQKKEQGTLVSYQLP